MKNYPRVCARFCASVVCGLGIGGVAPALAQEAGTGLLGDPAGLRSDLGNHGITLGLADSENFLGNLAGGVKAGATLQGLATATLDMDMGKVFRLDGGTFHISALQIHGQPLSPAYLHNLQTANGNEAEDGTRLWELWFDQQFLDNRLDVKIGQQSIDNEFITSTSSGLFVNTMAGWPLIPSDDLYGGGPAYPLSSLGVRARAEPRGDVTLLAGIFDDNPGGGAFADDAQRLDRNGGRFSLHTGGLFVAELQYIAALDGLPGTYKIGGWYDTGRFPDQRFGTDGFSLANPASNGSARLHDGNYSLYGVADQTVLARGKAQSINVFGRIMATPDNRNLIDFSFNGGIAVTAPLAGRNNDEAGIDFGVGRIGSRASALDQDAGNPARTTEELIEFTYQAQITPWLTIQPDVQYVVNPGGGVPDPNDRARRLRNEVIAGVRALITF